MTLAHPAYAQVRAVTPTVSVMLENNPGMMTLDGTNTWILRAPGRDECVVVDPGDADEEHLSRVAALGPVALTLITHRHFDHTGGVQSSSNSPARPCVRWIPSSSAAGAPSSSTARPSTSLDSPSR